MRIAMIVEGKTEKAFLPHLRTFLQTRLAGQMPKLDPVPYDGRIPTGEKLRRVVENLLADRQRPADAVIALTDVYTGSQPPEFENAGQARANMREWVGQNDRFHPHAAQYDYEAWLLPFWDTIRTIARSNRAAPGVLPEQINHINPPSRRIKEVFLTGERGGAYVKTRDAGKILQGKDLLIAAEACPELKSLLNSILTVSGGDRIL